jgi:hypothetical protein
VIKTDAQAMNETHHIPMETTLPFIGTIGVHWNYHAMLMTFTWLVLVPLCIIIIRFGKPKPTFSGLKRKVAIYHAEWWWFSVHKYGMYVAMFLSVSGAVVALTVSGGFSGSVHSFFGIMAVLLGVVQVIAGWSRGKHGGKYYYTADPNKPETWFGDHYNMTRRRRIFEAYHKNAGYFAGFCALAAVASGLMQYPIPWLLAAVLLLFFAALAVVAVLDFKGFKHDGYRAAHGYDPDHPFNKEREHL